MSEQAQIPPPVAVLPESALRRWPEIVIALGVLTAFLYFAEWEIVVLLVSILASFILTPVVDGLQRLRVPRGVGAFVAVFLLVTVLYGMAYFSYNQVTSFMEDLPKYSTKLRSVVGRFKQHAERLEKTTENVLQTNQPAPNTITVKQASNWTDTLSKGFGSLSHIALVLSFIPFLVYFMLTGQQHARAATVMLFPMQHRHTAYVTLGLISAMIRSFILGNFLVGLFISAVSTAIFALMHVPFFYVVGVISGFLSLVPYLGVILAMAAPLMVGIGQLQSSELLIVAMTVFGLHLIGLNVLYPKFLGKRLQLNPLAVTIALLLWGWVWGAMGLVLAIPITGALKIIFDHVRSLRAYGTWLGE